MYTYPSHTQYKIYLPLRIITSGLEPGLYITFLENHKIIHSMSKLCSFIYYMPFVNEQRQLVRYIHHMVCNIDLIWFTCDQLTPYKAKPHMEFMNQE